MHEHRTPNHTTAHFEPDEERRVLAILERAFDASFVLDSGGHIAEWNSRAENLFGWSAQEVLGKHIQVIVSPRHREKFASTLEDILASGEQFCGREPLKMRALHRSGFRFSTELFLFTRRPAEGVGIFIFVRNLAEQEQLRNLLAERADQRAILNFIEDGYTELDLEGRNEWVNDAYCRIFNRTREEVLDPSYQKITHNPVSVNIRDVFKKVYETGQPVRGFEYEVAPDRFCEITVSLKRGAGGQPTGFVTLIRDTTERKRHELQLAKAKEAADSANKAKSEFLASMSHEIRTPMNGILGMTDIALSTDLTEQQREYLSIVRSSAEDLLVIINDILDYSKIEAGKVDLVPVPFNLSELVGDTMKTLAVAAHRKNLELAFQLDAGVPSMLLGDPVRLRQILLNLTGNAVKFTEAGEVVVSVSLESRNENELKLHFQVCDTGIGIALDAQRRLFQPFEQADSSTTRRYGGTGLGLAISRRIVELMSGEIWLESALGQGSKFHFTVRMQACPDAAAHPVGSVPDLRGVPVLIIDDNASNRAILYETVQRWQMVPQTADSGAAGLAKLETAAALGQPFRLVLLDEQMPEMDGLEVIRRIYGNSRLRGATIMMLTSADQSSSAARCRQLGVDTYLIKPIKPGELLTMIQRALAVTKAQVIARPPVPSAAAEKSLSILVAEDNAINQKVAAAMLARMGHRVTFAGDGHEVLKRSSELPFDLILMDVQMPGIDGFEAARRIRERESASQTRIPIIAMTARAMSGDRQACLLAGMDDYISKPINRQALERALARYL